MVLSTPNPSSPCSGRAPAIWESVGSAPEATHTGHTGLFGTHGKGAVPRLFHNFPRHAMNRLENDVSFLEQREHETLSHF